MPLTSDGKKVLKEFKQRYGKRGEEVFYRKINSDKEFKDAMEKGVYKSSLEWWLVRLLYANASIPDNRETLRIYNESVSRVPPNSADKVIDKK